MRAFRLALLALCGSACAAAAPVAAVPAVAVVPLEGAIGPASADFVRRAIERSAGDGTGLVVLRIDTPGGLDSSMRDITKAILASRVPVAAFVGPSGARAASAGTFILYASHIAAMAPGTNLGAATPVSLMGGGGSDKEGKSNEERMAHKAVNDAVAYIRGFAQMRHRNAEWAEQAVREGVSIPAEEALKLKVIEHVVPDIPALLEVLGKADATVRLVEPDWRTRVLSIITNPSVAYLLILLGAYALLFEFLNPGLVLPGVVGAIALLLAAYALQLLPVNYAGLALIFVGIGFMVAEAFLPTFGSLGIGGLIAFVLGSVMLIEDGNLPDFEIPYALIGGMAAASAGFLIFMLGLLIKSRRQAVVSGREEMLGARGEALGDFEGEGWARVHGEQWKVRSARAVRRGQRLRVVGMRGLVLDVEAEGD
jgi:membrane-bound serine protease (ClpP class)